jgi:hypothetical protein
MYRDLKNLHIELVKNHRQKQYFLLLHALRLRKRHYDTIKPIYSDQESGIMVERQLYALAGVDFEKKWSNFFVKRDLSREKEFFEKIVPPGPYAFIHDDAIYSGLINPAKIAPSLMKVRAERNLTDNIFDYCTVIERADEIHVVDSVFMFLVDCLVYSNPTQKLFVHRYARSNAPWNLPLLKKPWTILS